MPRPGLFLFSAMRLANRFRRSLHWLSYASGASTLRASRKRAMRIIKFHGVGDPAYPAEVFESQLRFLKRHFSIVSLDTLVARTAVGGGRGDEIVLTFDDGLRNHYTVVYPILARLGVPAVFFVCPGLIESGRWLWNH